MASGDIEQVVKGLTYFLFATLFYYMYPSVTSGCNRVPKDCGCMWAADHGESIPVETDAT